MAHIREWGWEGDFGGGWEGGCGGGWEAEDGLRLPLRHRK